MGITQHELIRQLKLFLFKFKSYIPFSSIIQPPQKSLLSQYFQYFSNQFIINNDIVNMASQNIKIAEFLHPPLGKKPHLSDKQMKNMRMLLQSVAIQTPVKATYYYNIVQKQSNWGFSSHQRMLILNVQQKGLSYLSAIPQGYLPYTSYQQLAANKVKQKVFISETKQFRCNIIKGKISTLSIQWTDNDKNQKKWVLTMGSSKLMNDWVTLINSVKDNTFDKKKYDAMSKITNDSLLIGDDLLPPSSFTNNNAHSFMNNPMYGPQKSTKTQQLPTFGQGGGKNEEFSLQNDEKENVQANSNPFKSVTNIQPQMNSTNKVQTANNAYQLQLQTPSVNKAQLSNLSNTNQYNNPNYNSIAQLGYQSASTPQEKNNYQSPASDLIKKSKLPQPNNAYDTESNNYNPNNNFGSNYTQQPNRNTPYNNQQTKFKTQTQTKSKQTIPAINNKQLQGDSRQSPSLYNDTYKPYEEIYGYNAPSQYQNARTLQSSQSQPPNDFVQQLKRKRQKNPQKFVLNNQLSKKKFDQLSYQPQPQQHYPQYYDSTQVNNFGTTPAKSAMGQRVPSQIYFNQENSQNKFPLIHSEATTPKNQQHLVKAFSRSKINSNHQSIKDINPQILSKNPSKSQLSSRKLQGVPSLVGQNNYDGNQRLEEEQDRYNQVYKPDTSFPESTKNLPKIRSDYLRRKMNDSGGLDTRFDDNRVYPSTSKNQGRMLINEQIEEQDHQNYYQQAGRNQSSFNRNQKLDSSQRRREQSLHNLNKVNSAYLSNKNYKSYPLYNQLWLETSNPNKKIQVYDQFVNRSTELVKTIVEEISLPTSNRRYQPIDSHFKHNLHIFAVENMIIKLHFFNHQESINGAQDEINIDVPVLYNHSTLEQIKRQFYNYNLILGVTGNEGKIKVPLCCYIEYRGVLAVVKADIPQAYKQVEPYSYQDQFDALENMTKVRFMHNTFNCYESLGYRGGEGRFILLWNLVSLIPAIPHGLKNDTSFFRKQLLLQYDQILEDLESSSEAHAFAMRHILPELLTKLQSLEIQILHSKDLMRQFHRVGLSLGYLSQMYKQTQSMYLKKLFMSEIVTVILTQVVRSELNHAFSILPAQNMHNANSKELDSVIVSCAHILINQFFSYTQRSESIWKLIAKETSKRYRISVSKDDVIPGYILSGVVHKLNLECDFKQKSFLKNKKFFLHENILPRDVFITFLPKIRRFDMESICPTYSKCKQLIQSEQLSAQNYDQLSMILNLKNRQSQLPDYYGPLLQELKMYLANFIPYTVEQEYEKLDVYEFMYEEPITYNGMRTSFLAIKWLIKGNEIEKANQIFQIKFHELSYWLNEYNTAITEFYDFFSMFYASVGDFEESVCLAKSSLINMTKVLGQGALPVADKHYQLGNIYFKINKKNQALKEYNKTKQILINHEKITIPEYGIILLKVSLLCLNFGELTECLSNAIQAERIFQNNGGNEKEEVQCFEILARVYQITRKQGDMSSLCEACSKTFNSTENPKIMERMLKIITYPKISELSSQEQKSLLPILIKLHQHKSSTSPSLYSQSFNYLHKLSLRSISIKKKLYNFLQNVTILAEEVNRKDLIRRHISFNERAGGDAEQMLVIIEAIGNMIGWNFLIGMIKEAWYD